MVVVQEKDEVIRRGRVRYLEAGEENHDKPLVVFCHGFPDTAMVWEDQIDALSLGFQVLAPYWGRVGDQNLPNSRMELESLAMDLRFLIDKRDPLKNRQIFIVGHDMGGPIVREMEELLGDRLSGVVYLNSLGIEQFAHRIKSVKQFSKSLYMLVFQLPWIQPWSLSALGQMFFKVAHQYGGYKEATSYSKAEMKHALEGIHFYKRFIKDVPAKLFANPHKRTLPCLYLWGEHDPFLFIPTKKEISRYYPNGEIRVIPGGHWLMKTHRDQVNQILQRTFDGWTTQRTQ